MLKCYLLIFLSTLLFNVVKGEENQCQKMKENFHKECSSPDENSNSTFFSFLNKELRSGNSNFTIIPHNPNYLMPFTYAQNINQEPHGDILSHSDDGNGLKNSEAKFQFSFKIPLVKKVINNKLSFWFAYTQLSFWQVYASNVSKPFRENNYQPELLFLYQPDYRMNFFGMKNVMNYFHLNHQSNGRSGPQSRSWNRIMASFVFEKNQTLLIFKPWYRIPDKIDDNPGIHNYIGSGEIDLFVKLGQEVCGIRLFNNLDFNQNRTSIELSWSIPLGKRLKGIVQYYNGYSESLIDYNFRNQRLGIGLLLTDWL